MTTKIANSKAVIQRANKGIIPPFIDKGYEYLHEKRHKKAREKSGYALNAKLVLEFHTSQL